MSSIEQNQNDNNPILKAVTAIKTAILQGQYEAAKDVNRVQLALYYAIGRYLALNTRKGVWGTGALQAISGRLRKELPGLRGFSVSSLKNMRLFYEEWSILDTHSPIAIGELNQDKSDNIIDVDHSLQVPVTGDFPVEDFFRVPFTHHIRIIEGIKDVSSRYYYLHRVVKEHLSADKLGQLIKESAHEHQSLIPNNFGQTIPNATEHARHYPILMNLKGYCRPHGKSAQHI